MERLPNPPLVTDSMSSGGEVHDRLSMGAPGSRTITPVPVPALVLDVNNLPDPTVPDMVDRNLLGTDGSPRDPMDSPFPRDEEGQFASGADGGWHTVGDDSGSPWRQL